MGDEVVKKIFEGIEGLREIVHELALLVRAQSEMTRMLAVQVSGLRRTIRVEVLGDKVEESEVWKYLLLRSYL